MPPAVLAWLDYSQADQRRAREIVAMFSQRESRDELGLGGIRDALSDTLFPGTSFVLTRARYFLFVPWLFREGARRGHGGPRLASWVDGRERQLIEALHKGGDLGGLIGGVAGPGVQNLPSSIYWSSLRHFRILRHDGTMVPLFRLVPPSTRKSLFVRRFRDQRLPPYRLVMCSTTQQGPNLAPICGTTRDPAVQRACPQPRSHSSHWRSTAALPSAHPDTTSDRLNHDRKSLHSRPNH